MFSPPPVPPKSSLPYPPDFMFCLLKKQAKNKHTYKHKNAKVVSKYGTQNKQKIKNMFKYSKMRQKVYKNNVCFILANYSWVWGPALKYS